VSASIRISINFQLIHIFRGRNLVKGEYKHDSDTIEDIRNVEIVTVEKLKHMIIAGKVENAGTLIAYLICCTGIF